MSRLVIISLRRSHGYHWLLAEAIRRVSPISTKVWRSTHDPVRKKHIVGRDTVGLVCIGHHARAWLKKCGVGPGNFQHSVYVAAAEPMCRADNLRACKGFDVVVSCQNEGLGDFRRVNPKAKVIGSHLCADRHVFKLYDDEVVRYDVGMVATFRKVSHGKPSPYYAARLKWLKWLERDGFSVLAKQGLYGEKHARALCQCKIGLQLANRGFREMQHFPPALRVFETMAVGRLLICDRFDLNGLDLVDGVHYVTFPSRNYGELRRKVGYYVAHDEERQRIADAGRKWVLKGQTFDDRAALIVKQFGLKSVTGKGGG